MIYTTDAARKKPPSVQAMRQILVEFSQKKIGDQVENCSELAWIRYKTSVHPTNMWYLPFAP